MSYFTDQNKEKQGMRVTHMTEEAHDTKNTLENGALVTDFNSLTLYET